MLKVFLAAGSFTYIIAAICILALFLFIFLTCRWLLLRMDRHTIIYQNGLLEKHCEEVQNMYKQTRGWKHDYHDQIQTMKAYLAMGRLNELSHFPGQTHE